MAERHPAIIVFTCNFGWGYQGDRESLALAVANWLPVTCCGAIEAEQILEAFRSGADGILILACPRGECHYHEGDFQIYKRVQLLKQLLAAHRIDPERLAIEFGRDPSGETISVRVAGFARRLGQLDAPLAPGGDA